MKMFTLLFSLIIATNAFSQESACALDFSKLKSFFIQDKKLFKDMTPIVRDYKQQTLSQGVVMGNRTEVKAVKGGCNNYSFVINMTPYPKVQNALPHHLYRQTLQLLEKLLVERDEFFNLAPLKKSLGRNQWEAIKVENGFYILPCGEAKCTLRTIKKDDVDHEIEVTYDLKIKT